MDKTIKYIEMSWSADEIQKLWKREPGDFYSIYGNEVYVYFGLDDSGMFWLPRQDQLQEMVWGLIEPDGHNLNSIRRIEFSFNRFVGIHHRRYDSYEQLWLAFVMKKKYDKSWNKTEWRIIC